MAELTPAIEKTSSMIAKKRAGMRFKKKGMMSGLQASKLKSLNAMITQFEEHERDLREGQQR